MTIARLLGFPVVAALGVAACGRTPLDVGHIAAGSGGAPTVGVTASTTATTVATTVTVGAGGAGGAGGEGGEGGMGGAGGAPALCPPGVLSAWATGEWGSPSTSVAVDGDRFFVTTTTNAAGIYAGQSDVADLAPLFETGGVYLGDLIVDDGQLYWMEASSQVRTMPEAGGDPVTLFEGEDVRTLAADDAYVYALAGHSIVRLSKSPGPAPTLLTTTMENLHGLAVDATRIYWAETSLDATSTSLRAMPKGGGVAQTLGTTEAKPWASVAFINGLLIDDDFVYYASAPTHAVVRVPKTGGEVVPIASGISKLGPIALDSGFVYFSSWTTIARVPKAGGATEVVLKSEQVPEAFAMAPGSLWFPTGYEGGVRRLCL